MSKGVLQEKSLAFAIRIVKLYQFLCSDKKEFILSKQLLRSGTAEGAMVREAAFGESKTDFIHKLAIAQKEMNETIYWLELMLATNYLSQNQFDNINTDAIEIIKLITASIKTAKASLNKN